MCGIAGYIGKKTFYPNKTDIKSCLNLMKRRGPDFQNFKEFEFNNLKTLFCASRLSIIDLSDRSNQPFEDEHGILIFNGEIYNYLELKKNLLKKKIMFDTKSDTEVLLKYLNYNGIENLNQIHGMWSFAYFSKKKNKFYLSRDKFGEKPLFYSLNKKKNFFIFGSNVNYIKKLNKIRCEIDEDKIYNYLRYGFRSVYSENNTFFKNISFLNPGEVIEIDKNFIVKRFKNIKFEKYKPNIKNYNLAKNILRKKINSVIPKTFRSNVPIAFMLSGGIDSSIISYIANKRLKNIKFYSLKNKDKNYDESKNIKSLIKSMNLNHEFVNMKKDRSNFEIVDNIIKESGFPLLSTTSLAINKICQKVKKDGYKVIISGNGADEIFSGYYAHHISYLISIKKSKIYQKNYNDWANNTKPKIRTSILKDIETYEKNLKKNGFNFEADIYKNFFKKIKSRKKFKKFEYKNNDIFIEHLDSDLFFDSLPTQTHTIDKIAMYNSIESRMPFLTSDFYNFRNKLSKIFLIKHGLAKYILRDVFKYKLPNSILFNPEKTGFFLPVKEILNLKSEKFKQKIFKNKFLKKIINMKIIKKKINSSKFSQQDQKFLFLLYNAASFMNYYSK